MRLAPEYKDRRNLTTLNIGTNYKALQCIPYTLAYTHTGEPSILEKWLRNLATAFVPSYDISQVWYEDIPLQIFSDHLAMVLNKYLCAYLDITYTVGSDGASFEDRDDFWANTTGSWTTFTTPVYHVQRTRFLVCLVSAIAFTTCAVVNVVLRFFIHIADFLGTVSALTRYSPYIDVLAPASSMDGAERLELLRDK
jgi:hypothetical protein